MVNASLATPFVYRYVWRETPAGAAGQTKKSSGPWLWTRSLDAGEYIS